MGRRMLMLLAVVLVLGGGHATAQTAETPADAQHSSEDLSAVETNGKAILRICRDGFMFTDCRTYGHIMIPTQVMQGDVFSITFGSNPKRIRFRAEHIQRQGAGCDILGMAGDGKADRLTSQRCRVVDAATVRQP